MNVNNYRASAKDVKEQGSLNTSLKRRAVLRPGLPSVVEARGGNVGMSEPLLHLGDIGLMVERVR